MLGNDLEKEENAKVNGSWVDPREKEREILLLKVNLGLETVEEYSEV